MNPAVRRARKKPVEIEFMVWPGGAESATQVANWVAEHGGSASWSPARVANPGTKYEEDILEHLTIKTLEGRLYAYPGYVIIRGIRGEFYGCEPSIFHDTYEITTEKKD